MDSESDTISLTPPLGSMLSGYCLDQSFRAIARAASHDAGIIDNIQSIILAQLEHYLPLVIADDTQGDGAPHLVFLTYYPRSIPEDPLHDESSPALDRIVASHLPQVNRNLLPHVEGSAEHATVAKQARRCDASQVDLLRKFVVASPLAYLWQPSEDPADCFPYVEKLQKFDMACCADPVSVGAEPTLNDFIVEHLRYVAAHPCLPANTATALSLDLCLGGDDVKAIKSVVDGVTPEHAPTRSAAVWRLVWWITQRRQPAVRDAQLFTDATTSMFREAIGQLSSAIRSRHDYDYIRSQIANLLRSDRLALIPVELADASPDSRSDDLDPVSLRAIAARLLAGTDPDLRDKLLSGASTNLAVLLAAHPKPETAESPWTTSIGFLLTESLADSGD